MFLFDAKAQRTVSGKVTDDTGSEVPGVNVIEKGTTNGTTTDLDGNYSLNVGDLYNFKNECNEWLISTQLTMCL